jgi:autoinducer 2-degrading protein
MILALVSLQIRPDGVDAFVEAARANAAATIFEPGCVRFEVYRETIDEPRFLLLEIYRDQAAREEHWESAHFLAYKHATADLIENRSVTVYEPLDSPDAEGADAAG